MTRHVGLSFENKAHGARDVLNKELRNALLKIKKRSTFLPVCARCKRIRDGTGIWRNGLQYLGNYFEGKYTHTLCPTCANKLYPDLLMKETLGN
jgi:hypothetical protein